MKLLVIVAFALMTVSCASAQEGGPLKLTLEDAPKRISLESEVSARETLIKQLAPNVEVWGVSLCGEDTLSDATVDWLTVYVFIGASKKTMDSIPTEIGGMPVVIRFKPRKRT